jgi:hypothetical protein
MVNCGIFILTTVPVGATLAIAGGIATLILVRDVIFNSTATKSGKPGFDDGVGSVRHGRQRQMVGAL